MLLDISFSKRSYYLTIKIISCREKQQCDKEKERGVTEKMNMCSGIRSQSICKNEANLQSDILGV